MLNSAEHELFFANKYENAKNVNNKYEKKKKKKCQQLTEKFSCSAILRKKEDAIVSDLRFINRTNFMLSWVAHEKRFITWDQAPWDFSTVYHRYNDSIYAKRCYHKNELAVVKNI